MRPLLVTGGMLLGALVFIVVITQILDVVLSQKPPVAVDRPAPVTTPNREITPPPPTHPQPGARSPLVGAG